MLIIIQARTNSKRFKNKIMTNIFGRPLIWHLLKRIQKVKYKIKVVVATSINKSDDKFIKYLKSQKIKFFRGSLLNVAKRMHDAAKKNNSSFFVRISADSPIIDPKVINRAISIFKKNKKKFDLITNTFPKTYPQGQSVEILRTSSLKKSLKHMNKQEKEHVTKFFYNNYKNFRIKNFVYYGNYKSKQAIDTKKDLINIKKKFKNKFMENLR